MKYVILITGAGTGMGRLASRTLAKAGHTVYASMRFIEGRNKAKADEVRLYANEHNINLYPIELDILSDESIAVAVKKIMEEQGRIDVLVHNAAHLYFGITEAFTPEQVISSFNTNVVGALRVNRAVLPIMRDQKSGLLIWVGSGTTRVVPPFLAPYTAAKAAMDSFADSVSYEVSRYGIESSIVMPGIFMEGTEHFPNAEFPADTAIQESYLPVYGDALERNEEATRGMIPPGVIPDVQAVANEITRIVNLPHGTRPYRSSVDFTDFGDQPVNEIAERMREQTLTRFGFADLLHPQPIDDGR